MLLMINDSFGNFSDETVWWMHAFKQVVKWYIGFDNDQVTRIKAEDHEGTY